MIFFLKFIKLQISKLFWSSVQEKPKINYFQKIIRENEWESIKKYIIPNSSFLDVGCGSGHNLNMAKEEFNCKVVGIDPAPGKHGVGRNKIQDFSKLKVIKGNCEDLPFESNSFDVVFCSHVLEHVKDEHQSLIELRRVLKPNGTLIIGMPTAFMALQRYFLEILFESHIKLLFLFKSIFKKDFFSRFLVVFIPRSHSYPRAKTIFYDLIHYRTKSWRKIIKSVFYCKNEIATLLYPFPQYPQLYKIRKSKIISSSVFFVCSKTSNQ